jgi:hypothetical protein
MWWPFFFALFGAGTSSGMGGDATPGGANDVILMANNINGILQGDNSSFIKLAG